MLASEAITAATALLQQHHPITFYRFRVSFFFFFFFFFFFPLFPLRSPPLLRGPLGGVQ